MTTESTTEMTTESTTEMTTDATTASSSADCAALAQQVKSIQAEQKEAKDSGDEDEYVQLSKELVNLTNNQTAKGCVTPKPEQGCGGR